MQLRSGLCVSQWSSSKPVSFNHVFMDLALCIGVQTCCNRKGPFSKLHNIVQNVLETCAEALRFPIIGNKAPSPTLERQPHTHPSSTFSPSGELHTTLSSSWHCTCEACMQPLCHGNTFHVAPATQLLINASGSLELQLWNQQSVGKFYTPCASALGNPAMWPYMISHFMAELLLLLNTSTVHLQLTMEFHKLTDCKTCSFPSQYNLSWWSPLFPT